MAEYIDREKVYDMLNALGGCGAEPESWADGWDKAFDEAIRKLDNIPAADVRPERHGKWVSWEEAGNYIPSPNRHECSVCHDCAQFLVNGIELLSSYCPNCGAKMDGEDGENNGV